ncbi:MAG: hypothetical protein WBR35_22915 [Anaerolineae bacterium]
MRTRFVLMRGGWLLVNGLLLLYALVWLLVVSERLRYPFDLDFIEGGLLVQAWRMARGLPVFLAPNVVFVPHAYTPLFPAIGALLLRWTGPALWPLRLISVLAALMTATVLGLSARREYQAQGPAPTTAHFSHTHGFISAGLFCAGYGLMGGWYDLARVDALFVLCSLAGVAASIYARRRGHLIAAALCLGLAFFSKQTALGFGLAAALWLWLARGRQAAAWFALTYAAIVAGGILLLNGGSQGAFVSIILRNVTGEPLEGARLLSFAWNDLLWRMGPLLGLYLWAAWRSWSRPGRGPAQRMAWLRQNPWLFFTGVALLLSALQRARPGGALNTLLPAYTFLCLAPVMLHSASRRLALQGGRRAPAEGEGGASRQIAHHEWVLLVSLLAQLLLARYDPRAYQPTAAMTQAGERLVTRVRQAGGQVWLWEQPTFNLLAGQEPAVQVHALWHARRRGVDPLPADVSEAITARRFALIIPGDSLFDQDPALQQLLQTNYVLVQALSPSDAPPTLNAFIVRPAAVYRPRP